MSKHYYIIVDTETTKKQTVADFGAVVVDRQGRVVERTRRDGYRSLRKIRSVL